ncbi:Ld30-like protein [Clanis bilineata nucleopolyhedrovirus]|uniref:Ld30-like protein n=1 Tax=Clanis bilineata nucleopolyhedrovirus TaxID=1307957 RepID=Q0N439_9ABAC|nr:Ld30-like protein [Clanis bilineata nucleopolyhedrovirus]ABF47404.1 Ld30-like protein [Clanis bilineata nucleopolyhedrovirus]
MSSFYYLFALIVSLIVILCLQINYDYEPGMDPCYNIALDNIPHPVYCDRYIFCANYKPIILHCPPGYLFNENKKKCDLSANVDCGNRI